MQNFRCVGALLSKRRDVKDGWSKSAFPVYSQNLFYLLVLGYVAPRTQKAKCEYELCAFVQKGSLIS